MPADSGAFRIFSYEGLLKCAGSEPGEVLGPCPDASQKFRHILSLGQPSAVKVVAPAVRHDPAFAGKTLEFELPKRQVSNVVQQKTFFVFTEETRLILKALGNGIFAEKIECQAIAWHAMISGRLSSRQACDRRDRLVRALPPWSPFCGDPATGTG